VLAILLFRYWPVRGEEEQVTNAGTRDSVVTVRFVIGGRRCHESQRYPRWRGIMLMAGELDDRWLGLGLL